MPSMDTGWVGATWENHSGLADEMVLPSVRETAAYLQEWVQETRGKRSRGSLFNRTKYIPVDNPFEQMRVARTAVSDDDIVSSAADVTEGLILQGVSCESKNEDVEDIFNQWAADVDLDSYLRTFYRELFTYSQSVTATYWGTKSYTSRVRSVKKADGAAAPDAQTIKRAQGPVRRKVYSLRVPVRMETLDPTKVIPIGASIFGQERLAWHASAADMDIWQGVGEGLKFDAVMTELFIGKYTPALLERAYLAQLGINPDQLIELNPKRVWRHCLTKSSYDPFPVNRMKSIFPLLDMKQQLMESDRVTLVGAANYILLVRKGTEARPASQPEVDNLKEGFQVIAKLPVIVSDHRLDITIITPKLDMTLDHTKYDTLDKRILNRLFGIVEAPTRGDGSAGVSSRTMARVLENKRRMMRRSVEEHIFTEIWDSPANDELQKIGPDVKPALVFSPRNVQLDADIALVQAIVAARQARELSRESFLEVLDFDQNVEARRMEREAEVFDSIFKSHVPFDGKPGDGTGQQPLNSAGQPAPGQQPGSGEPPAVSGARGGRPTGGGLPPGSAQGKIRGRTATGAPKTGGSQ